MAFSHNGKLVAVSAGRDDSGFGAGASIRIWDLATATLQAAIPASTPTIYFNANDTQIIGQDNYFRGGYNGVARIWNIDGLQWLGKLGFSAGGG